MARRNRGQASLRRTYRFRLAVVALGVVCVFAVILARLYILQVIDSPTLMREAREQQQRWISIPPRRGEILDRNGAALATSAMLDSLFLDQRLFGDKDFDITRAVAQTLGMKRADLLESLKNYPTPVRNARKIPVDRSEAIRAAVAPINPRYGAVTILQESKRLYPRVGLAAHLLGFCVMDDHGNENVGAAGLESAADDILRGSRERVQIRVSRLGQAIEPLEETQTLSARGRSIELTLDAELQRVAEVALAERVEALRAKGGVLIAMDPRHGDILAMASYPGFVPDRPETRVGDALRNRAIEDVIQPGSVMKIFTFATALEQGLFSPDEMIDCEGGRAVFHEGRVQRAIRDFHPLGVVSGREAFAESSNIAAVKVGLRIPPDIFYGHILDLGLTEKTNIGLAGEATGRLTPLSGWSFLTRTSVPFGYEVSSNSLQLLACVSAIANGGIKNPPPADPANLRA